MFGSVRGAVRKDRPYRDPHPPFAIITFHQSRYSNLSRIRQFFEYLIDILFLFANLHTKINMFFAIRF